ncbi:LOW QUALITY PROTEIN: cGMP-dependent protein kinase 1 [Electrophorus electricus]|uniref:LOW QUALITY PROTEIN: cGMP-dependent protein kinase 1 n=1 Tax=Electrophorus electricus TaxID=8005 RepID=UPI0015D0409A|nr:LOW QUALITY PROTEIN: cGMP-dependent protein kinase 1 [Electrophorus electricus]
MGTLRDLQFALQLKIEELRQRDALIDELELELDAKDDLIRRLQGELDRLRLTISTSSSSMGQHHVASLRAERRAVQATCTSVESEQLLHSPPLSHSKSQESRRVIEAALRESEWLMSTGQEPLQALVDAAYPATLPQGAPLTQEGEEVSQAFILEEGKLEVSSSGQKVHIIEVGMLFGELALLYNYTCTSTVKALMNSKLWVIEHQTFQRAMQKSSLLRLTQCLDLLHRVPLLCGLPEDTLIKVSDTLEELHYSDGDVIHCGSVGEALFIVSQGQVRVLEQRLAGEESACVSVLSRGDCFGERELKGEAIRLLSAVASGDVTCLVTDRESIQRFMGAEDNSRECESGEPKAKPEVGGAELCDVSSSDVQVLCNLGEGRFGHTQLVHLKEDASRMLALRIIRKRALVSPSQRERVLAEKQITMDAHCPFIVRLYSTFRDAKCLYMLTEACLGGDLWTLLRDRGPFEESVTCFYTACVLEALACLHDRGVVHRDLKPENVLLDQRGYAKLSGFACAKKLDSLHRAWSFCGSPGHQAPEVILQKGHSLPADLWGLGVFVYELLNGSPPFTGADLLKTCAAVLKGIDAVEFPRSISRAAAELVKGLCREDPSKRLGCGTLLKDVRGHKFFEGFDWEGLLMGSLTPPIVPNVHSLLDCSGACSSSESHTNLSPVDDSDWDKDF